MRRATLAAMAAIALLLLHDRVQARSVTTLAPLLSATTWLNGHPAPSALRGKVVVVDVFTVDCINCKNVTPNLRSLWTRDRAHVAVVGVHTPETAYERDRAHVVSSLHPWRGVTGSGRRRWDAVEGVRRDGLADAAHFRSIGTPP